MHKEVKQWINHVRRMYPQFFFRKRVLEVGSLNINGSPRSKFYFCDYTGIDLQHGKGVDEICFGHDYETSKLFDVVVSTECLEHDRYWKLTLKQMYKNLRPEGLMIVTCASIQRPEHGTRKATPQDSPSTLDYYGNISILNFIEVFGIIPNYNPDKMWCPANGKHFRIGELAYKRQAQDLMFWGIKK